MIVLLKVITYSKIITKKNMVLPANFQGWEHLQDTLRKTYNKEVKEEFSDAVDDDIATPRGSLKKACLIDDNDTADICALKMLFFYVFLRKAQDLQQPYYGIPVEEVQAKRAYSPQIFLYFLEDVGDTSDGYKQVAGEISIRLMNEDSATLTKAKLTEYAKRIKASFAASNGYIWKKGKEMVSYTDWDNGYQLQLLVRNKSEGKELIQKVLDIRNHTPDWDKMQHKINESESTAYPIIPGSKTIMGKTYKKPRKRPIADVRFQYAVANVHGIPTPIPLVDRSYRFRSALVN